MIEIDNLCFSYNKKHKLINNLNLTLKTGNIYGLLGKNGAGKTTLLKLIAGMLFPKSGYCSINGFNISKRQPKALSSIYFIPEEFELTGSSPNEFANMQKFFYKNYNHAEYQNYLNTFGVNPDAAIKALSFGQKKQVLISFGLATNTKYLILDEPTNSLDIPSKSILRKLLASAINEQRSFIISTHQIRDLDSMIDPIIIMDDGKIVFHENSENIIKKLTFKTVENANGDNVVWAEKKLAAYNAICKNTNNEFTNPDLELLFNGVIEKTREFESIFKK